MKLSWDRRWENKRNLLVFIGHLQMICHMDYLLHQEWECCFESTNEIRRIKFVCDHCNVAMLRWMPGPLSWERPMYHRLAIKSELALTIDKISSRRVELQQCNWNAAEKSNSLLVIFVAADNRCCSRGVYKLYDVDRRSADLTMYSLILWKRKDT
jgi:hypothetical protein